MFRIGKILGSYLLNCEKWTGFYNILTRGGALRTGKGALSKQFIATELTVK